MLFTTHESTFVKNMIDLKTILIFLFTSLFLSICLFGQDRISTEDYIETYKDVAIQKMKEYKIPASITLAQGILESGSGNSKLAKKANNHFGIKCHKEWKGKTYHMDDDAKDECFRKYGDAADSYRDHSIFLTQRGRYSFLFDYEITDYENWAKGLKKAGYATNPKYPQLLINLIEKYDLSQYDTGKKSKKKEKPRDEQIAEGAATVMTATALLANSTPVAKSDDGRDVFENNSVRFIVVKEGDTFYGIAEEFDIYSWQLFKYNEMDKEHMLQADEIIYLEKKKKKADKLYENHTVKEGESLQYISQLYGIRLSRLQKMNALSGVPNAVPGTVLKLR